MHIDIALEPEYNANELAELAVLAEQNDEWCCARRYMSLDSLKIIHDKKPNEIERREKIAA